MRSLAVIILFLAGLTACQFSHTDMIEAYPNGSKKIVILPGETNFDLVKMFYENGKLEAKGLLQNGLRAGCWFFYNTQGKKIKELNYQDGNLNGKCITYYPSGKISENGIFFRGEKKGVWQVFYPNGQLLEIKNYQNGNLEGHNVIFWENGKPKRILTYADGKIQGKPLEFNLRGEPIL